jgi:tRNA/rRNA methyltransferase/tRNA (cytidine32/uridine32-2'-O)-methyltransferase
MTEDTPEQTLARHFVVVLNRTQDIVNIAGTARAMMNMGLERLRLVKPDLFDAYRISGIAHGSEWLLERVEFFDTLEAAVADAGLVVGTTARRRTATYVWDRPRNAAPTLLASGRTARGPICLVFGREDTGLLNDELDRCDRLLVVPANPRHSSLNLAQAVLLTLYELRMAALEETPALPVPKRKSAPGTSGELQRYFDDAERALDTIEFFKSRNAAMIMRSLRAITRRANPTEREIKLLRAIMIEVRKYFERTRREQI